MIEWIAIKLSGSLTGEARMRFLLDLKYHPTHVVAVFKTDVITLISEYAERENNGKLEISKDPEDPGVFTTCAKRATSYLKTHLQEELSTIFQTP